MHVVTLTLALVLAGCMGDATRDPTEDTSIEVDLGSETDTGGEADTAADANMDVDAGTDTASDTDIASDTNTTSDTDTTGDTDTDSDTNTTSDTDTASDTDAGLPVAELTNLPLDPTHDPTASIQVGGAKVVTYRFQLDGGGFSGDTPISTPIALSGLADGVHVVEVLGSDGLGNDQEVPTTASWTVDTQPPTLLESWPFRIGLDSDELMFVFDEDIVLVGLTGTLATGATPQVVGDTLTVRWSADLPLGSQTLDFEVTDLAGNVTTGQWGAEIFDDADVLYVDDSNTGTGGGDGTRANPFQSFLTAYRADPSLVLVATGTYQGDTIRPGVAIAGGYAADFATRDPEGTPSVFRDDRSGTVFQTRVGFTDEALFDGVTLHNRGIAMATTSNAAVRLRGSRLYSRDSLALTETTGASAAVSRLWEDNTFESESGTRDTLVVQVGTNLVMRGNTVIGILSVTVESGGLVAEGNRINTFRPISITGPATILRNEMRGGGLVCQSCGDSRIENNVFVPMSGTVSLLESGSGLSFVSNTIVIDRDEQGRSTRFPVFNYTGAGDGHIANNFFDCSDEPNKVLTESTVKFQNAVDNGWYACSSVPSWPGMVNQAPGFADLAGGDYHLTPSSPCSVRQGGSSTLGASPDFDGNPRTAKLDCTPTTLNGDGWSLGAFELD